MANILIVSGHPDIEGDSVANKAILEELARLLPDAQIDRLDLLYPDYRIDIAAEQAKLVAADIIVLAYPVWWYSCPALMHKWMEDVFAHGFSHGRTGDALAGKKLVASLTAGAPAAVYEPGAGAVTADDLTTPLKATCALTRMEFAGHVFTADVSYLSRVDEGARAAIASKAREHAASLVSLVASL